MHRFLIAFFVLTLVSSSASAQSSPRATAKTLQRLAALMERDWKDPPEWAQMAKAVINRRFSRQGQGWWKPGESRYNWQSMAKLFDANESRVIEKNEVGDLVQYFERLDQNKDGQITRSDLMEQRPQPTREMMMARELFSRFDRDDNGKLTKEEVLKFFEASDKDKLGFLTLKDLSEGLRPQLPDQVIKSNTKPEYQPGREMLTDLDMLLSGQMGSLTEGPKLNDMAPDFTLTERETKAKVTLSKLRGRPVVLIFGSFT